MSSTRMFLRNAAGGAVAMALLAGCAGGAKLARIDQAAPKQEAKAKRQGEKAVSQAEKAVERNPQSASLRTELGLAYLKAGRFQSAVATFNDAMSLGDNSSRTALSLALAKIGTGKGREAVAILDDWRESIPAADLGLAIALAGEGGRGVAILSDALRGGENTPKLRQNLAYAYALDGRWREARTMAEQDVPADQVDRRMSEWALTAKPDDYQTRVAGLLGAPVRIDPGLPEGLALTSTPQNEQLAAEATATAPQAGARPVSVNTELPAAYGPASPAVGLESYTPPAPVAQPVALAPVLPPVAPRPVVQPFASGNFASAFSTPVVATQPAARPARPQRTVRVVLPKPKATVQRNGTHLVQLGSFSSPQGARRAWGVLSASNASLREYRMVITPAVVRGKNYWRVAAAGFDAQMAKGMCSTVRGRGGVCFAYAATSAPAGARPAPLQRGFFGPQMARR